MSDPLIDSIVRRLEAIAQELKNFAGQPGPKPPPPGPTPPPAHSASLDVSETAGKPGETVQVVVTGQTSYPAEGFACAIGYESLWLEFVKVEWSEFLQTHAGQNRLVMFEDRPRGHPRVGNAGAHIVLSYFFIDLATGVSNPILFPPETTLAHLEFKIKESAPQRHKISLLNRTKLFGKLRVHALVPPSEETPDLEDGWIQVLPS